MELPLDTVEEGSWWLEEAANAFSDNENADSDEDSFGEFKQADQVPKKSDLKLPGIADKSQGKTPTSAFNELEKQNKFLT
jgi:hypothetical protein